MEETSIVSLICGVQNYDWGVVGSQSLVASLKHNSDNTYVIYKDLPYAELWMGTHPRLESQVVTYNGYVPLSQYIEDNKLPELKFLFKVLSVNQALSIQVHPNKNKAAYLRLNFPDNYSDSNHKPEMAIAISKFSALIGFRKLCEIYQLTSNISSLHNFISVSNISTIDIDEDDETNDIKNIVSELVRIDSFVLKNVYDDILSLSEKNSVLQLFKDLFDHYQYDIGCLFAFFMNYVELNPGEAIVIGPNVPHCYLKGDIVECMANSDNVVRLGLTKKFKDADTMLEITDFQPAGLDNFKPKVIDIKSDRDITQISRYISGFDEFNIVRIKICKDIKRMTFLAKSCSLLIVICGSSKLRIESKNNQILCIKKGDVRFIKHDGTLIFVELEEDILAFLAEPNISY